MRELPMKLLICRYRGARGKWIPPKRACVLAKRDVFRGCLSVSRFHLEAFEVDSISCINMCFLLDNEVF